MNTPAAFEWFSIQMRDGREDETIHDSRLLLKVVKLCGDLRSSAAGLCLYEVVGRIVSPQADAPDDSIPTLARQ
jgi:hypothetical protein